MKAGGQNGDDGFAGFAALEGERRLLADRVWENAKALGGDAGQVALREAFVKGRYAGELRAWPRRRDKYRLALLILAVGIASLGIISSGLVAAAGPRRSTATDVVLIVIGVLVAVLTTLNQLLNPGTAARQYQSDEFTLRDLGWQYLRRLEEGTDPREAYASFQAEASRILGTRHPGVGSRD